MSYLDDRPQTTPNGFDFGFNLQSRYNPELTRLVINANHSLGIIRSYAEYSGIVMITKRLLTSHEIINSLKLLPWMWMVPIFLQREGLPRKH